MTVQKLLLDTNIILDFLGKRGPHFAETRLLMVAGKIGEFSLWIASSQITDLIYILTNGGNKSKTQEALEKLRSLRTFINVHSVSDTDIDRMLATTWNDPEDALLVDIALRMRADAVITRDAEFPKSDAIRVHDCPGLFAWLEKEKGISYAEVNI